MSHMMVSTGASGPDPRQKIMALDILLLLYFQSVKSAAVGKDNMSVCSVLSARQRQDVILVVFGPNTIN